MGKTERNILAIRIAEHLDGRGALSTGDLLRRSLHQLNELDNPIPGFDQRRFRGHYRPEFGNWSIALKDLPQSQVYGADELGSFMDAIRRMLNDTTIYHTKLETSK